VSQSKEKKENKDKDILNLTGTITEVLPGSKFRVEVDLGDDQKHSLIGYLSGKMRMHYIKLQIGDEVELEVSKYDLSKGRITYRNTSRRR
jgi:translation initiation factor IF-1